MRRRTKVLGSIVVGLATIVAGAIVVGQTTTLHVLTVTRQTSASEQAVWELWADVPERTRWDGALAAASVDGPFELGATGEVELVDQPARRFEIIAYDPPTAYTDRFFLPAGGKMDWHHSVVDRGDGSRDVTFRIEVGGPTAVALLPVLKMILREELPPTVDKLVDLAEQSEA